MIPEQITLGEWEVPPIRGEVDGRGGGLRHSRGEGPIGPSKLRGSGGASRRKRYARMEGVAEPGGRRGERGAPGEGRGVGLA